MTNRYWMVFFSAWHWVGVCVFSIARAWSDYDVVGAHRVWGLGVLDLGAFHAKVHAWHGRWQSLPACFASTAGTFGSYGKLNQLVERLDPCDT